MPLLYCSPETLDNDDTLKELKNAEVLYCSLETFGKYPIHGQSIDWNCCGEITLRSELV